MTIRCEDYPCCGHTPGDPCDTRSMIDEPWYCDQCGFNHAGFMVSCPADEMDEDEYDEDDCEDCGNEIDFCTCEDDDWPMEDQWLDGSYEE